MFGSETAGGQRCQGRNGGARWGNRRTAGPRSSVNEPSVNEHGAEVSERRIFSWGELGTTRWDADQVEAQILTGQHMHMIRATYDPGATYEMHSHPHEQFSLLLSGRMRLTVGEETREIGPGDGWYAPGGVPTAARCSATSRQSSSMSIRQQPPGSSTCSPKAGVSRGIGLSLLGDSTGCRRPVSESLRS